jgi:hypothetical protein
MPKTDQVNLAIRGTTQDFLEISDIRDDLVLMIDGSVSLIIKVAAVNFGLLSEREQEAIIYAYAGFLNSLNFAVQIIIRSQKKDISSYVAKLDDEKKKQTNALLATQIESYRNFVFQTVKENNVLDKKFYIAVPFSSLELGVESSSRGLVKKNKALPLPADEIIKRAKVALEPKRDHVLRQLGRLGLRAKQVPTPELIELFYEIYNFKKTKQQGIKFEQILPLKT